jgi:hypothetical protein
MENHNAPSEYVHPIQTAITDLRGLARMWLEEVASPDVAKIRRATARASDSLEIAADGCRRVHHLRVARECMLLTRSCFKRLFLDGRISSEKLDEARRRLAQALTCIARLRAVGDQSWSTVEMPAIEEPPVNLDDEPTLKSLRLQITHIAAVVQEVREREEQRAIENRSPPVLDAA